MTYQSVTPYDGRLLKTFDELTDKQLETALASADTASRVGVPWTIIETGAAHGRRMTSWPSLKSDLENAGAEWVDEEVTVDRNLLTSRKPQDIPSINAKMIELFSQIGAPGRAARS